MTPSMVALVLCAALLHVGWNAVVKVSGDRLVAMVRVAGVSAVAAAAALVIVPWPAPPSWTYLGLSAALHTGYMAFLLRAYGHGDLSQVYPIARGAAPLLVLGLALVAAGELPHGTAIAAIMMITFGVIALALRGGVPASHGWKPVLYALGTAVFIACYTVVDGLGARQAGTPHGYAASLFVLNGVAMTALLLVRRRRGALAALAAKDWPPAVAGGIMSLGAYWLVIWALTLAPMAPVAALRETSVIFAAGLGSLWLKEPFGRWSVASAALVAAGIVVLQSG